MTDILESSSLPGLLSGAWRDLRFEPFRPGVEISRLYGKAESGASAAVLRYQPGARVPRHRHTGHETVLVLEGSQRDLRGVYRAGDVVLNLPGSMHDVTSDDGCVALVLWQQPIEILDP